MLYINKYAKNQLLKSNAHKYIHLKTIQIEFIFK